MQLCFDVIVLISAVYCLLSRSANLLNIERVLLIAERYIISVEELHTAARSILPHGASFQGLPLTFNVVCDAHKKEFPIQVWHKISKKTFAGICFLLFRNIIFLSAGLLQWCRSMIHAVFVRIAGAQ